MVAGRVELAGRDHRIVGGELAGGELLDLGRADVERDATGRDVGPEDAVEDEGAVVLEVVVQAVGAHEARAHRQHDIAFKVDGADAARGAGGLHSEQARRLGLPRFRSDLRRFG